MTDQQAAPLTAEEEAEYRYHARHGSGAHYDTYDVARLLATLDRDRSAPSDGGLREAAALVVRLDAESRMDEDDWADDPEWQAALDGLRAALAATPTPAPAPADLRLDAPVRLRFGQEVILECGDRWGGDHTLVVGFVERTATHSLNGSLLSSEASREYVLMDPLDADFGDTSAPYRAALSDSSAGVEGQG